MIFRIEITDPDDQGLDLPPAYFQAHTAEQAAGYVRSALEGGSTHIEIFRD